MRQLIFTILMVVLFTEVNAQTKYFTKTGYAKFYSEAPLENIEAENKQVKSIIDAEKQDVVISMLITGFVFDNSLMQEHFNENYLESEKFPTAEFQGSFVGKIPIDVNKDGTYAVKVNGNMTIHGVTQAMSTDGTITIKGKVLVAKTVFIIKVADYDIEIPTIVFKNIAEEVEVTVELKYNPLVN